MLFCCLDGQSPVGLLADPEVERRSGDVRTRAPGRPRPVRSCRAPRRRRGRAGRPAPPAGSLRATTTRGTRGRSRRTRRPRATTPPGRCSATRRAAWWSSAGLLLGIAARTCRTWYGLALPLSFWMLTRGSPGHGVLNTACEPAEVRGAPKQSRTPWRGRRSGCSAGRRIGRRSGDCCHRLDGTAGGAILSLRIESNCHPQVANPRHVTSPCAYTTLVAALAQTSIQLGAPYAPIKTGSGPPDPAKITGVSRRGRHPGTSRRIRTPP